MWNLAAPPGFRGLDPQKPVVVYQRHMPHWRQAGASYFVTFRLADSLPRAKLDELKAFKKEWEQRQKDGVTWDGSPEPSFGGRGGDGRKTAGECRPTGDGREELAREIQRRVEGWLDQGMGRCVLRHAELAAHLVTSMHHFDGERHELGCYVVMPNHVHAIVRPFGEELHELEEIIGGWKKYSAKRINIELKQQGELWQDESFDRILRDEEHLWRAIQYVGSNPERAGLERATCPLWVRPEWVSLGWGFDAGRGGTARESRPTGR